MKSHSDFAAINILPADIPDAVSHVGADFREELLAGNGSHRRANQSHTGTG